MISGLSVVRGGSRLTLLPAFVLSSSCLASSRLCRAKASRGDSSGGISPAICRRGDLSGRETEACDSVRSSRCVGRVGAAMLSGSIHRPFSSSCGVFTTRKVAVRSSPREGDVGGMYGRRRYRAGRVWRRISRNWCLATSIHRCD